MISHTSLPKQMSKEKTDEFLGQINNFFGDMDLYLIDQLLKSNIPDGPVLDLGCGTGRNAIYFLQNGYDITAVDSDQSQIQLLKHFIPPSNEKITIQQGLVQSLALNSNIFETVLCSRVCHELDSTNSFDQAWEEINRVLMPRGILYFTMNAVWGLEEFLTKLENGLYEYPDGRTSLLMDQKMLDKIESDSRYEMVEIPRFLSFGKTRTETQLLMKKI